MQESEKKFIFIVGSPRSGTTMTALILGRHPAVHTFHELWFFEKGWSPADGIRPLHMDDARKLERKLLAREVKGGLKRKGRTDNRIHQGSIVANIDPRKLDAPEIYKQFLMVNTKENNREIPCEHTPGYIFYLEEILELFPRAKVISLVRDPRDVLLSQKKRWRQRLQKESEPKSHTALRVWMNYHPVSTSHLWYTAVRKARSFEDHPNVHTVRYEDILNDPEQEILKICRFIGIDYFKEMLRVPRVGSSHVRDNTHHKGIDKTRSGKWRKGGLNSAEIFFNQSINHYHMKHFHYLPVKRHVNPALLCFYLITFPAKLLISFFIHTPEIANIGEAVRRRLS